MEVKATAQLLGILILFSTATAAATQTTDTSEPFFDRFTELDDMLQEEKDENQKLSLHNQALREENERLRNKNEELRSENARLKQKVAKYESIIDSHPFFRDMIR